MIIDAHVHLWRRSMYPDVIMDAYLEPLVLLDSLYFKGGPQEGKDWLTSETDSEELVNDMKVAKIDRSVILPLDFGLVGPTQKNVEEFNDWIFETCAVYPEKLTPFIGVDPQRGELALKLVEKYVKKFDARGVKVYPPTGWRPDEERIAPFWKLVDELGLFVVTHSGAVWGPLNEELSRPSYYAPVLERHHSLKLVVAHMGGKFRDEVWPLLEKYPNVYTDCSALQGWLPSNPDMVMSRLSEVAKRIPERVFFGTDWPLFELAYSQPSFVDLVKSGDWGTEEMKERLFSGNFLRAFDR
ncbi:MAG: amidohydrolase family protein [Methanomassiliicoccales archaeon]|jgi:predicted TIM-barrel fold metal-dependent hydrolase